MEAVMNAPERVEKETRIYSVGGNDCLDVLVERNGPPGQRDLKTLRKGHASDDYENSLFGYESSAVAYRRLVDVLLRIIHEAYV
jgi:hypothetical protein